MPLRPARHGLDPGPRLHPYARLSGFEPATHEYQIPCSAPESLVAAVFVVGVTRRSPLPARMPGPVGGDSGHRAADPRGARDAAHATPHRNLANLQAPASLNPARAEADSADAMVAVRVQERVTQRGDESIADNDADPQTRPTDARQRRQAHDARAQLARRTSSHRSAVITRAVAVWHHRGSGVQPERHTSLIV
jgi:hypothetical protein